ncbi:metal-dependent hydrolase [Flavobacterium muglaense]|uniref:Metal-dependent hydrolase n=1 Tax=Flavobacterium muglaense TaxID=2764716 RepID=A0A923SFS5_9FLAO|nr:metal-dependent hydrolase [Flavobacterium muglaense]MBC5838396.1 metal-dependent hydrolase [Flavobacterium muglaense]MBC5844931.1 metal-dependent hydrolase [Flavobacterium muglaense]
MDSFTQIALGIAVAEVCAGKKLKNKTVLYGSILGTIPDLDVLVGLFLDPVDAVLIHRGISHSLFLFGLLSPVLGWIISKIEKGKISYLRASNMVFWCFFTHVLLDMFTSWGTQILWPLDYRFALKTIFVIDPLYTIPLVIALLMVWKTKDVVLRKKYIIRGLFISSFYLLVSCFIKLYALNQFEKALYNQGIQYSEIIVKPTAFNIILWNANVATTNSYLLADYSLLDSQPITFTSYDKNKNLDLQLNGNSDFEKLKKASEGWYILTQKNNSLFFNDLRFGLLNDNPQNPQFAFNYKFIAKESELKAVEVHKSKRDGKRLLLKIANRIKGN